jgi:hypothetical protein
VTREGDGEVPRLCLRSAESRSTAFEPLLMLCHRFPAGWSHSRRPTASFLHSAIGACSFAQFRQENLNPCLRPAAGSTSFSHAGLRREQRRMICLRSRDGLWRLLAQRASDGRHVSQVRNAIAWLLCVRLHISGILEPLPSQMP